MDKSKIASAFGKAALTYEDDAPVQKMTAQQVIDFVNWEQLPPNPSVLEIGCGTGFLTELLVNKVHKENLTISDLSADMLAKCRDKIGEGPSYYQLDGEHPNITGEFDLIITSLAVQWFLDLEQGLSRLTELLAPGGFLVFSTLGEDSFVEWKKACRSIGLSVGMHPYPSYEALSSIRFEGTSFTLEDFRHLQKYQNGYDFLRALKAIGAERPVEGYAPLSAGSLRRAMRELNANKDGDCEITYHLLFGVIKKDK